MRKELLGLAFGLSLSGFVVRGLSSSAAALGTSLVALATLLPFYPVVRRRWGPGVATASLLLLAYGTQAFVLPLSPAGGARAAALCLGGWATILWWRGSSTRATLRALAFGALAGVIASFNPVGLALLGLPACKPFGALTGRATAWRAWSIVLGGLVIGFVGGCILTGRPTWPAEPRLEQALFDLWGPQHGLFYWSPLLWLPLLFPAALIRRERSWACAHAVAWLVALVAASTRAGLGRVGTLDLGFEALLGTLVLGMGGACAGTVAMVRARPRFLAGVLVVAVLVWNLLFMEQYTRYQIPRDDTVAFDRVAANSARLTAQMVGAPTAWPAVWWFGARSSVALDRYDSLLAQPLWRGDAAHLEIGEPHADGAWILEGWDSGRRREDTWCRPIRKAASILVPIPRGAGRVGLGLRIRAHGHGTLAVAVNGTRVAERPLSETFSVLEATVPERYWAEPVSRLGLEVDPDGDGAVDWIEIEETKR